MIAALQEIDKFLNGALASARKLTEPGIPDGRISAISVSTPRMTWLTGDMSEKEATFVNGDDRPITLCRMSCYMQQRNTGGFLNALVRYPSGWRPDTSTTFTYDFRWNYTAGRRQARYAREDRWLSSQMLAGRERSQFLEFKTPLVLGVGESITTKAALTLIPPGNVAPTFIYLQFRFEGYR